MGEHQKAVCFSRSVTLNSLKTELHSLNMRMLLAMRNHDGEAQERLGEQMAELQTEIDRMSLGSRYYS